MREPAPTSNESVAVAVVAPPFAPDADASRETPTNQTAEAITNVATIYRQAFALFDALSMEEKELTLDWRTNVDASAAAELCGNLKPIVALAHQAVAVTNCDWGMDAATLDTNSVQIGTFQVSARALEVMHTAEQARSLARMMVWNAAHCREGDSVGLGDDLAATLRLGQSLSHGFSGGFLGYLTDGAIERLAIAYLADTAGALPDEVAARLKQLFDDEQYEGSFYSALDSDIRMRRQGADRIAAMSPEEAKKALQQRWGEGPVPPTFQAQFVAAERQFAELEGEYAQALTLPEAQYQAWLDKLHTMEQADTVLASEWSDLDRITDEARAVVVQRAMVVAGLAVVQDGPDALASHPDPATGQPFTYTETTDGFALESTFQLNGKSVKLSFK
ncbi:MAG TPA: hypothetical protein VMP11_20830 [Verrucomicrobiae bacterium]|nr:hypothetical protein [Verrucomicrobiae bacterium]